MTTNSQTYTKSSIVGFIVVCICFCFMVLRFTSKGGEFPSQLTNFKFPTWSVHLFRQSSHEVQLKIQQETHKFSLTPCGLQGDQL